MNYGILQKLIEANPPRMPRSQLFNEGWMLRLLLLKIEQLPSVDLPFARAARTRWFSEASLMTPYPKTARNPIGEDPTNADALLGDFTIRGKTETGVAVVPDCKRLIVLEAKLGSELSKRTTYAEENNQVARSIACMACELFLAGLDVSQIEQIGFYLIAPESSVHTEKFNSILNLEALKAALDARRNRCATHEACREGYQLWWARNEEAIVECLLKKNVELITWERCIDAVRLAGGDREGLLATFYSKCWFDERASDE